MSSGSLSLARKTLFTLVSATISASGVAVVWLGYRSLAPPAGQDLNRLAWEANFRERGLPVPARGPRDGYWGARMPGWVQDPDLGWHEAEAHLPGLVEEDAAGVQRYESRGARAHVLVLGASVAWGAYASGIEETYFARLARRLARAAQPVRITVLAAGAWTSENELAALRARGLAFEPDVVLWLNGLNEFTQGPVATEDERVDRYLRRMREARNLIRARGGTVVFALQPFLPGKPHPSRLERRILELTFLSTPEPMVRNGYPRLRRALEDLATEGTRFVDCSGAFDGETATTFTDIWHFADPGHRLLGECLAEGLVPVLRGRP